MESVAIYMRGQPIKVSVGTVLDMSLNAEKPEDKVSVKVQGIEFVVSRAMLYAKSNILAETNFFTKALEFYTGDHTTIEISRDSNDEIAKAYYYPVLFDYMRRCALSGRFDVMPLHDYDMQTDDAVQLHRFLEALCVLDYSKMLPVSEDGREVYVAIVPEAHWGSERHQVSRYMCTDPEFVRLCMLPADQREQSVLDAIKKRHEIDRFSMRHVNDTTIRPVPRGSCFAIEQAETERDKCYELDVFFLRTDYMSA